MSKGAFYKFSWLFNIYFDSNLDCLHYIINLSCDANLRDSIGRTPLHYASANSSLSFVRMLVETDADVSIADIRGCTALHFASSSDEDGRYDQNESGRYIIE